MFQDKQVLDSSSKRKLHTQPSFFTSCLLKPIVPRNTIKIDWHASPFSKLENRKFAKFPDEWKIYFRNVSEFGAREFWSFSTLS